MKPLLVLHVLPIDIARGAQTYARELRSRLDGDGAEHRTLTIFRSSGATLVPDYRLDVPNGRFRALGIDVRAAWRLRRFGRELRPDVVVAHGGEPLKYAVLAGLSRSRLVYYKIGIGSTGLHGPRLWLFRALLRRAGVVAAVSEDVAREVSALGIDDERIRVIPNGRDPRRYAPRPERSLGSRTVESADAVRLAFVGHLTASKRPQRFVELIRTLRATGCAVSGVMAGAGSLRDEVADAARDLPIDVLGEVDDVPGVLAASDIFIFTSIAAGEGMPGVLIEAGMASLPVVTTGVPGAAEVVESGATGFVVAIDDFDALVAMTRRLVVEVGLREQMGAAARQRCADRFALEPSIEQWRVLLSGLLVGSCTSST